MKDRILYAANPLPAIAQAVMVVVVLFYLLYFAMAYLADYFQEPK